MADKNKKMFDSLKNLSLLSQLGLSIIIPPLLSIWFTVWLKNKLSLGDWVVIVGIFFGMASGIISFTNYAKMGIKDAKKNQKEYEDKFKDKKDIHSQQDDEDIDF